MTIQKVTNFDDELEWSKSFPTEPGNYWFYGLHFAGASARHRNPEYDIRRDFVLHNIEVHKTSKGITATSCGRTFVSIPYNKEANVVGWLGKFAKVQLPLLPNIGDL